MRFVYHHTSSQFVGDKLYPLNQLKMSMPEIYAAEKAKYDGREELMKENVAILDCLWNDVIHLSPIHPAKIYSALQTCGLSPNPDRDWFVIPLERLTPERTVIYSCTREDITPDQFTPFHMDSYNELAELPKAALQYYRSCAEQNERPLLFNLVPHVLHQNPIDISGCEVIRWSP